ncbi:uncharacterized protein LLCC_2638 [Lactococcus cremoris]|nr:uncharacterized protein LLCC_2638 [Lactococcus cremoris]
MENQPTFCPNCGKEIEAGSVFCTNCGTKWRMSQPMKQVQQTRSNLLLLKNKGKF